MYKNNSILLGKSEDKDLELLLSKANRHGIITGATGSGKTITLKVLAEGFSDAGVPVFLADVKGDLAGCCQEGEMSDSLSERINKLGLNDFEFKKYPVRFWDLYGLNGHPIRTTLDRVGPQILSIMLGLNEAQEGILTIIFKVAKDENLRITDLKDLRKILQYVADNKGEYITKYGNITSQSDIINLYNKYSKLSNRPFRDYSYSNQFELLADMMKYYYFKYLVPRNGYKDLNYPNDIKEVLEKYICISKNNYNDEKCK